MKNNSVFKEFRPALRFLAIFAGIYILGNTLYGLFVEFHYPAPDPLTILVTRQTSFLITLFSTNPVGWETSLIEPVTLLKSASGNSVLRVFEGCNGLNVVIVFISFVVAFGGSVKRSLIFIAVGCFVIHFFNLLRIILLYYTAIAQPKIFYYFHKYFFTAILYLVVFGLWIIWTRMKPKADEPVSA